MEEKTKTEDAYQPQYINTSDLAFYAGWIAAGLFFITFGVGMIVAGNLSSDGKPHSAGGLVYAILGAFMTAWAVWLAFSEFAQKLNWMYWHLLKLQEAEAMQESGESTH